MNYLSVSQLYLGTGLVTITGKYPYLNGAFFSPPISKSITVESPASGDVIPLFYSPYKMNVNRLDSLISGTGTSVTYTVRSATQFNGSNSYELKNNGIVVTGYTTGQHQLSFDNNTISGGNWTWLSVTNISGSPAQFHLSMDLNYT